MIRYYLTLLLFLTISCTNKFIISKKDVNCDLRNVKIYDIKKEYIDFDDGDTFYYKKTPIRILGIDTPEIIHEEHGIYENQEYGLEAANFTKNELLKATTIQYIPFRKDRYKRLLAHVLVDNKLLSVKLIEAGLAYETISFYGSNGFNKFEQEILKASKKANKPKFEHPIYWRRKHQKNKKYPLK